MKKNYFNKQLNVRQTNMRKYAGKISSLLILFFISLFAGSVFAQSSMSVIETPWKTKNLKNEITTKRTRTSKSFASSNNRITSIISPSSMHYLNQANEWTDINTKIVANQGTNATSHPFASTENAIKTWFPANPFTNYILMSSKEGTYKEKVKAIQFLDAQNNVISSLPLTANIQLTVNENKIVYSGFDPNLTLEYTLGNDSRKFDLVVQSSAFMNSLPAGAVSLAIVEEFITENSNSRVETASKEISVYSSGKQVFSFSEPVAFDNNQTKDEMSQGFTTLTLDNHLATISSNFDLSWILSNARQFPIHLDPTVNYYPQTSNFWTGYQTSSSGKSNGYLRLTSSTTAAWAKFDLSTLPPGCTVTQADYHGYHYSTTSSTKFAEIHGLGALDPVTASASTLFSTSHNGTLYNSSFTWGGSPYGWHVGALNSTGMSDVAAAAGNWIGLGFAYASGSTTFMYHYGNNASSNKCYLEVTYFTVPCSNVPGANSAISPTYAICPGSNANVTLANTYSVGGISYQWQSSTTSSVGPFTSVPGATNAALMTPTLGVSTWYNALITCSNTTGTTTASVAQVMVQATTTNSIPYSVSFEVIPNENELPNCSWYAPNLGSTALTYTAANTLGRIPRTGSRFASFYYSPYGANYFYTNGLQLVAGVSYSASLWYRTEYYGYTNWSDLSILIGTSQSTTGLVNVASTNGAATSTIYKLLSGTFSVATSGIYYVAVRGTSSGSGAQYLTWDDLKVTKPCSINSPTLTLNTNTTTICAGDNVVFTASGADTYIWNTGGTGSTNTETLYENTIVEVVGTDALSGCTSIESQLIIVNPKPVVYILANPNEICAGSSANLSVIGNNSNSYIWSDGSITGATIVSPTISTTYSVIATNAYGCIGNASQNIEVNDLPDIVITSSSNEMCLGETVMLTADGADTYIWDSNTSSVLMAGTTISVSPLATTTFSALGTDEKGCSSISTFELVVNECTGLSNLSANNLNWTIYPNPSNGEFTIAFNSLEERTISVTDLTGRFILNQITSDSKVDFNLSQFAKGIYYVSVKTSNGNEVMKIITQ